MEIPRDALGASWCNGAAGHVYLWTLAHRLLGDPSYLALARMAAWSAYRGDTSGPADLCCGFAGRAYALLCFYKATTEPEWLARARVLARHAIIGIRQYALRHDSLYKGDIGVALLATDLERPERACMPLYESEGWPRVAEALRDPRLARVSG